MPEKTEGKIMRIESEHISDFFITEDTTIIQAMELLDKTANKILFVQYNGILQAAVTDGDVRRWILKGGDLKESVRLAANYNPIFLEKNKSQLAPKIMMEMGISAIPLVNKESQIVEICFLNTLQENTTVFNSKVPVVIMAGGIGSRLSPYTNILPKPLIPIGELPIVEHIINQFKRYGCDDFRMIVNYKRNMIKAYFNDLEKDYSLSFISEEKSLGTGGGLSLLKGKIGSTFILTNCDILIEEDLNRAYEYHKNSKNIITMIYCLKKFVIPYGVVNVGEKGNIKSLQEKPSISFYTNTGCYFIEPEVIEGLEYNKFVDFTTIVEACMADKKKVGIYSINENAWLDMGQIDELEKMKERINTNKDIC